MKELLRCAGHSLVSEIIDFDQVEDGMMVAYGVCDQLDELKHTYHGLPDFLTKARHSYHCSLRFAQSVHSTYYKLPN